MLILLYLGGTLATLTVFLTFVLGVRAAPAALIGTLTKRDGRRACLLLGSLLAAGILEAQLDSGLTARLGLDFTAQVFALEGDLVARVQNATPDTVRRLLGLHYLLAFPALLVLPVVFHSHHAHAQARQDWLWTLAALGLLALPFYLLVPVLEPAASGLSAAGPALETLHPGLTGFLRMGSAPDNCLPSLHLAAQLALVGHAGRFRLAALGVLAALATVATAWATLALGIHWVIDLLAAAPLALLALASTRALTRKKPGAQGQS